MKADQTSCTCCLWLNRSWKVLSFILNWLLDRKIKWSAVSSFNWLIPVFMFKCTDCSHCFLLQTYISWLSIHSLVIKHTHSVHRYWRSRLRFVPPSDWMFSIFPGFLFVFCDVERSRPFHLHTVCKCCVVEDTHTLACLVQLVKWMTFFWFYCFCSLWFSSSVSWEFKWRVWILCYLPPCWWINLWINRSSGDKFFLFYLFRHEVFLRQQFNRSRISLCYLALLNLTTTVWLTESDVNSRTMLVINVLSQPRISRRNTETCRLIQL